MSKPESDQSSVKYSGVLSDTEIRKRLGKDLFVEPLLHEESQVHSCKIDLRLSGMYFEVKQFSLEAYDPLDPPRKDYRRRITLPLGVPYVLHPGNLVLATIFENLSLPRDLLGILQGRSSLGRLGVIVHATAGFVDPKFKGVLTLELSNLGHLPVKLYTLSRVATIIFVAIHGEVKSAYDDKMQSPVRATQQLAGKYSSSASQPSKYSQDWEWDVIRDAAQWYDAATADSRRNGSNVVEEYE